MVKVSSSSAAAGREKALAATAAAAVPSTCRRLNPPWSRPQPQAGPERVFECRCAAGRLSSPLRYCLSRRSLDISDVCTQDEHY